MRHFHPTIPFTNPSDHPYVRPSIHSLTAPSTHLSTHPPTHPSIHPPIHPPTNPCTLPYDTQPWTSVHTDTHLLAVAARHLSDSARVVDVERGLDAIARMLLLEDRPSTVPQPIGNWAQTPAAAA